jgi:hypothetical protein
MASAAAESGQTVAVGLFRRNVHDPETLSPVNATRGIITSTARKAGDNLASKADTPGAANDLLKKIRALIKFAIESGVRTDDPTLRIRTFPEGTIHTWTEDSVVSAPIFKDWENYRGYGPALLQVPKLEEWVAGNLAVELASMPQAIIVPLGRVADEAIQFLKQKVAGLDRRCLAGFPHPSGANGHRLQDFKRGREQWANQISALFA